MVTARKLGPNTNLLARIQWVLDERGWNRRQFSIACGRVGKYEWNENTITAMEARLKRDPDYEHRISRRTYEDMARAAQVSLIWLMFGTGEPNAMKIDPIESAKYPNLERAVANNVDRWHHGIVALARSLKTLPKGRTDLTVADWEIFLDNFVIAFEKEVEDASK